MAIAMNALTFGGSDVDDSSYATASTTPSSNALILFCVVSGNTAFTDPAIPTASGNGMTWVQVSTALAAARRLTVFRTLGTPSAGATTASFGGETQRGCCWSLLEFTGVNTTGTNGSGAVLQPTTNTGGTVTSLTITLAAFGNANNATFGAVGARVNQGTTPGTGFTEIHDQAQGGSTITIETQYQLANDTSVDWSWASATDVFGIALEVVSATAAATVKQLAALGVG